MKSKKKVFIGLFFLIIPIFAWGTKENFPVLKGPCLGQKAPTAKAELFLDGIISMLKESEMCAAFTKNGKEFYFNKFHDNNWAIFCCREVNGKWLKPEPISFTSAYTDRDFTISPDGTKIYFGSNRPRKKGGETLGALDLFVTQMTPSGQWSEPRNIGPPVNTNYGENYPSVAQNGNLYFFSCRGEGFGGCDIYMARRLQGRYIKPQNLGRDVNSEKNDWAAYIAPDESYLIFSSQDRDDTIGGQDLYICYRKKNGGWTQKSSRI